MAGFHPTLYILLFEFCHQERGALAPPPLVSNRVLDGDLVEDGTIVQFDGNSVSDGPLLRVVVLGGEGFVLDTSDLGTESVNSRVGGSVIGATRKSATGRERERKMVRTKIGRSTLRKLEDTRPCS